MALVFVASFYLICNQFLGVSPFFIWKSLFLVIKLKVLAPLAFLSHFFLLVTFFLREEMRKSCFTSGS